ncbi:MAG: lipoyl(octanoyl) transferase LipB [Gemmatimonadota bacterium]|nr:lipoyl(octanoyl) transferase LipB [Gemmatimonadota bacterium]
MINSQVDRELWYVDLGLIDYDQAHLFQRAAARLRIRQALPQDLLILCEHPPVVTLGRSTKAGNLLVGREELATQNVLLRDVERGGDVTVHEPGQTVGYPIIDLTRHKQDLHWYLRQVEEALILTMGAIGLRASRISGQTGVWIDDRKLASIGVHARDWVTSHGFALNAFNSLSTFQFVVPCGLPGVAMTSVVLECGRFGLQAPEPRALQQLLIETLATVFKLSARIAPHEYVREIRAEMLNA